jgi:hypothetical protein
LYAGRTLHGGQRELATRKIKALKESIKAEYKRLKSEDRHHRLNDIEKHFYYPAIHESLGEVSALRWDGIPNGRWHAKLYSSRTKIQYYVYALKNATAIQSRSERGANVVKRLSGRT